MRRHEARNLLEILDADRRTGERARVRATRNRRIEARGVLNRPVEQGAVNALRRGFGRELHSSPALSIPEASVLTRGRSRFLSATSSCLALVTQSVHH
jgi:hypothetical protein